MEKYPCIKCRENCTENVILCAGCDKWIHHHCVPMSLQMLRAWTQRGTDFQCRECCFLHGSFDFERSLTSFSHVTMDTDTSQQQDAIGPSEGRVPFKLSAIEPGEQGTTPFSDQLDVSISTEEKEVHKQGDRSPEFVQPESFSVEESNHSNNTQETEVNVSQKSQTELKNNSQLHSLSSTGGGHVMTDVSSEEYECQYFGFSPKSLINGEYNAIATAVNDGLGAMETFINQQFGAVISPEQTREGMSKILSHVVKELDKTFDKLEPYLLQNVFNIPSDVVLPEDEPQMMSSSIQEDYEKVEQEIQDLQNRIDVVRFCNEDLRHQISDIDSAQEKLDHTLSFLQTVKNTARDNGFSKDCLQSAIEHSKELMRAVNNLQDE